MRSKRVDLRKVAGEVNPADLFTKHSLTRERLMGLTKLFDLEFRGGRAASAPKTRVSAGARTTLAEEMSAVGEKHDAPIMPHRLYVGAELDQRYPSIQAVEVEDEDEELEDEMVKCGEEIARSIVEDTKIFGRRKVEKNSREPNSAWLASTSGTETASRTTLHGGGST